MIDRFGREIESLGDGVYVADGLRVEIKDQSPIGIFNTMAPVNWVEPQQPLDAVGALATLLAVAQVVTVKDAANAVGLTPEQLSAEAEAWTAAENMSNS